MQRTLLHANTEENSRKRADSRQWENPKTWPMLHQGIAGPIQSGRPPPSSAAGTHTLWIHILSLSLSLSLSVSLPPPPPPATVSWSSAQRLPPSLAFRSVTQQPRPASLHHPPLLCSLPLFTSSCIRMTAAVGASATAEAEEQESVPVAVAVQACCYLLFIVHLCPSVCPSQPCHVISSQDPIGCKGSDKSLIMYQSKHIQNIHPEGCFSGWAGQTSMLVSFNVLHYVNSKKNNHKNKPHQNL